MAAKPPGARELDRRKVPYELVPFDPAIRDAAEVAAATGHEPRRVYKTLVVEVDPPAGKPYLVMLASDRELDLKALARVLGHKRMRMASHRDAERHTGLRVGGISAVALLGRGFRCLLDEAALGHETILVSAGERGYDLEITVADLVAVTGAQTAAVAR